MIIQYHEIIVCSAYLSVNLHHLLCQIIRSGIKFNLYYSKQFFHSYFFLLINFNLLIIICFHIPISKHLIIFDFRFLIGRFFH